MERERERKKYRRCAFEFLLVCWETALLFYQLLQLRHWVSRVQLEGQLLPVEVPLALGTRHVDFHRNGCALLARLDRKSNRTKPKQKAMRR